MKLATFDLMRVWAAVTGLVLAAWFFIQLWLGNNTPELVPMLAVAIGGFELVLFAQDFMRARRENG